MDIAFIKTFSILILSRDDSMNRATTYYYGKTRHDEKPIFLSQKKLSILHFFVFVRSLLLIPLIQAGGGLYASQVTPKGKEWRPKGVLAVPRQAYLMQVHAKTPDSLDPVPTLWSMPSAYMIRVAKNKWHRIRSYNCDEGSAKVLADEKVRAYVLSGGTFIVGKYSDGDYSLKVFIPGKGGLALGRKIGEFLPYAAATVWGYFAATRTADSGAQVVRGVATALGTSDVASEYSAQIARRVIGYSMGAYLPTILPNVPSRILNNPHFNGVTTTLISELEGYRDTETAREAEMAVAMAVIPATSGEIWLGLKLASEILGAVGELCPWF